MVKVRTPVGGQGGGGPYGPKIRNILSRTNFVLKFESLLKYSKKKKCSKKFENQTFGCKMAGKKTFEILQHQLSRKMENHLPKEFFQKIWLISKECKYIYIAEIKLEKKSFGFE